MRTGEKMEDKSYIERLMEFGLTRQEAGIYGCLISEGKTTGYEVAKQLGNIQARVRCDFKSGRSSLFVP